MNNALLILALIVWAVSSIGLIIFVLLHSGKGTGLSEMLGGAMSTNVTGTSLIEKNLDRITIGFAIAFGVSLLVLMVVYPKAL
ncbi:MAG: preprotein translocase subunit SecG [Coriobacteriia bacterium]|nr:preprotein translocase subunit SecG [Coriobacteriia bacterium]